MSKANPIDAPEIPAHMLEEPRSRAQKKAFAKAKREAAKEARPAKAKPVKRSGAKRAESDGGYGTGAGKDEKP